MTVRRASVDSPLGPLTITEQGGALVALDWGGDEAQMKQEPLAFGLTDGVHVLAPGRRVGGARP